MDIIERVIEYVESECKKPESKYGYEPFLYHFPSVVSYAQQLADELGADKELVTIAAWLHDIGSIVYGRENHHVTGAEIAEKKLREFGYPQEKIEVVKKCILNHRGSQGGEGESLEEQIVAEADVMSNFDNVPGIFKAAFMYEGLSQIEAKTSAKEKLERKWKQLKFDSSKKIVKPKYEAAMVLFS